MSTPILIADDSPAVGRESAICWGKIETRKSVARPSTALTVFQKAQQLTPDLIVLDYFMPKIERVEAAS